VLRQAQQPAICANHPCCCALARLPLCPAQIASTSPWFRKDNWLRCRRSLSTMWARCCFCCRAERSEASRWLSPRPFTAFRVTLLLSCCPHSQSTLRVGHFMWERCFDTSASSVQAGSATAPRAATSGTGGNSSPVGTGLDPSAYAISCGPSLRSTTLRLL